jgi:chemotaxis protein methyltransferase CheR
MLIQVPELQWSQLSEFIADRMGLHFPPERWNDLKRGFAGAAHQFGFADPALCIDWLLSAPPDKKQLQVLASHLTIGETYFFRDQQTLAALAENILPELIRTRRGREQRLRIWSAACCSGEEPYSLAILLHQLLPDIQDWQVTITATDINPCFLQKAMAGIYGEWSFRNAPVWLKQRYFKRTADGRYLIVPQIKRLVNFTHLNLVEDVYPSLATETNAMDIIFCRNVLMYFSQPQIRKVIENLAHALVGGGWLVVSPSEASKALFPQLINVNFPGAILFKKSGAPPDIEAMPMVFTPVPELLVPAIEESLPWAPSTALVADREPTRRKEEQKPVVEQAPRVPLAFAQSLYHEGRYAEAADMLLATFAERPLAPAALSLLARALANQGKLADALVWCERWIATDKLDAAGHYLHALVLLEQGDSQNARMSLQRAVYLDHNFVMAHFALGNLARSRGNIAEAGKHFSNAQHFLRPYQQDDLLPEADGLTAGRLTQTLTAMTDSENMR